MKKIENFERSYNDLIDLFMEKYYDDEDTDPDDKAYNENEYLGESKIPYMYPICVAYDYWDIDTIYMALKLDIPRDIVYNWHIDSVYAEIAGKKFPNLYNYYKRKEKYN